MRNFIKGFIFVSVLWTLTIPVSAQEFRSGDVTITNAWMRATARANFGAKVFFDISISGENDEIFLGASTPIAPEVEIMQPAVIEGIFRTLRHEQVLIPPGEYQLHSNSIHLTLLRAPVISEGSTLSVTLKFERAGNIEIQVPVLGVRAKDPRVLEDAAVQCMNHLRQLERC